MVHVSQNWTLKKTTSLQIWIANTCNQHPWLAIMPFIVISGILWFSYESLLWILSLFFHLIAIFLGDWWGRSNGSTNTTELTNINTVIFITVPLLYRSFSKLSLKPLHSPAWSSSSYYRSNPFPIVELLVLRQGYCLKLTYFFRGQILSVKELSTVSIHIECSLKSMWNLLSGLFQWSASINIHLSVYQMVFLSPSQLRKIQQWVWDSSSSASRTKWWRISLWVQSNVAYPSPCDLILIVNRRKRNAFHFRGGIEGASHSTRSSLCRT